MFSGNQGGGYGGGYGGYGDGGGYLGQFLGGMFGNSGNPYQQAGNAYQQWAQKGINAQNPFYQGGLGGMGAYQAALGRMQDPNAFVKGIMANYQQSPWAKFETQQGLNAGSNAASASGTLGSTPFSQSQQQFAQGVSSQDMQNYLNSVLGANQSYLNGEGNLAGMGANAANQMSGMYGQMGTNMGQAAYGQQAGQNQDWNNMIGGGIGLAGLFL